MISDASRFVQNEVEIKGTVTGALLFLLFLLLGPGAGGQAPARQQEAAQKRRFLHAAPATRHLFPSLILPPPPVSLWLPTLQSLRKRQGRRKKNKKKKK